MANSLSSSTFHVTPKLIAKTHTPVKILAKKTHPKAKTTKEMMTQEKVETQVIQ